MRCNLKTDRSYVAANIKDTFASEKITILRQVATYLKALILIDKDLKSRILFSKVDLLLLIGEWS